MSGKMVNGKQLKVKYYQRNESLLEEKYDTIQQTKRTEPSPVEYHLKQGEPNEPRKSEN